MKFKSDDFVENGHYMYHILGITTDGKNYLYRCVFKFHPKAKKTPKWVYNRIQCERTEVIDELFNFAQVNRGRLERENGEMTYEEFDLLRFRELIKPELT